jgi:hypothetical protein
MLKNHFIQKINDVLLIFVLIIKLIFNLAAFSFQYLILKIKERRELTPLLVLIFLLICLINWQLWTKRQNPQIILLPAPSQNPGEILYTLSQEELNELQEYYLSLEKKQKNNRDILFNLGKILELENSELAEEKFSQSWELDPNYSPNN